mmetsp:Transcript_38552/g.109022  ORF Transcript_38552/g.109022 Transcript_38552/m.109022 type:complete len:167 (-) Transcript_38552:288-788(-)
MLAWCSMASGVDQADGAQQQLLLFRVRGDGNCLFRALAQGFHMQQKGVGVHGALPKPEETRKAETLRANVAAELRKRRCEIEPFIDQDYEKYVRAMEMDGTWGGEPELAVGTHVLRMPIRVYSVSNSEIQLINEYGSEYAATDGAKNKAVSVFFHGMGHYDLLASP